MAKTDVWLENTTLHPTGNRSEKKHGEKPLYIIRGGLEHILHDV